MTVMWCLLLGEVSHAIEEGDYAGIRENTQGQVVEKNIDLQVASLGY